MTRDTHSGSYVKPNCTPEDKDSPYVDGVIHDFREVARDEETISYRCPRCGASDME